MQESTLKWFQRSERKDSDDLGKILRLELPKTRDLAIRRI